MDSVMYVLRIHVEAGGVYFKIHCLCPCMCAQLLQSLKRVFFLNQRASDFSRYSD